jgi:hypothetical protein
MMVSEDDANDSNESCGASDTSRDVVDTGGCDSAGEEEEEEAEDELMDLL